jgi:hypothetical protein
LVEEPTVKMLKTFQFSSKSPQNMATMIAKTNLKLNVMGKDRNRTPQMSATIRMSTIPKMKHQPQMRQSMFMQKRARKTILLIKCRITVPPVILIIVVAPAVVVVKMMVIMILRISMELV